MVLFIELLGALAFMIPVLVAGAERDWAAELFNLSMSRYHARKSAGGEQRDIKSLHLLRVPKTGSSSLSAVARRLAGCVDPPGPCCKYPGTPKGSCPSEGLFACSSDRGGPITGCAGHEPNYRQLLDQDVPSVSIMREPMRRAMSAFFYPGEHHNSECDGRTSQMVCFDRYMKDQRYTNVAVKLLSGSSAYAKVATCLGDVLGRPSALSSGTKNCKHSYWTAMTNLPRFNFMGVSELWELSMVLLYEKFPAFRPELVDFTMKARSHSNQNNDSIPMSKLAPGSLSYDKFEAKVKSQREVRRGLFKQNQLDISLYRKVVTSFKQELKSSGLFLEGVVKDYWQEKYSGIFTYYPQRTKKAVHGNASLQSSEAVGSLLARAVSAGSVGRVPRV